MSHRAICAISTVMTSAVTSAGVSHAQFASNFHWNNPSEADANTFNWSQIGFPLGIPDNSNEIARFQLTRRRTRSQWTRTTPLAA